MSELPTIFQPGDILNGTFELLEYVDGGGQAEVWTVKNKDYPQHLDLAVKLRHIEWDRRDEHDFVRNEERLTEEARLLGGVRSHFIVRPHQRIGGFEEVRGKKYAVSGVVMDFARDGNLLQFSRKGAFTTFTKLQKYGFLRQMALGLRSMQHHDIVHNDIKPANILVMREGHEYTPAYADFGYAFQVGVTTASGGTLAYMAPELIFNTGACSYESDIFSLGVTFYEVLLGRHPLEKLLSAADQRQALQGYFNTVAYIDSAPLADMATEELTGLIQNMCSRDPLRRPPISEVLEVLDAVTVEAQSQSTVRPEDLYPDLASRYRWSAVLHEAFGEHERIAFLDGTRPDFDPVFLNQNLARARLSGYALFRMLGASDYVLRVWLRDSDVAQFEDILRIYRAERGQVDVFVPMDRWPQPTRRARSRYASATDTLSLLQGLADGKPGLVASARRSEMILGESKALRERGHRHHAIRAVCRVKLRKSISSELAAAVAEKTEEALHEIRALHEIEVLANPGQANVFAEFLLFVELGNFHAYPDILQRIERTVTGLVGPDSVDRFRSAFEMDAASNYESYDGRLLHELHRNRPRRTRPSDQA